MISNTFLAHQNNKDLTNKRQAPDADKTNTSSLLTRSIQQSDLTHKLRLSALDEAEGDDGIKTFNAFPIKRLKL